MNSKSLALIVLLLLFGFVSCDKDNNQETSTGEFCLHLNSDSIDETISIINDYLAALKNDLSEEQKIQTLTKWLKSHPCVIDATLCLSCIKTLPLQSEISFSFKEGNTTKVVVLDIIMTNPLNAGICSISEKNI